jgi:response regulator RpfG family c-di-GMP phosphodiesterase
MNKNADVLNFAEERENGQQENFLEPWKVLIVDDEEAVHNVTLLALEGVKFDRKPVKFISCYTGEEAKKTIAQNPDIAVILLDVVMETDTAGLDVVRYIREEIKNNLVRIVLRTGQPGQAPQREVIVNYDINDYKEKTELTSSKLFTMMYSSLRAYRDINSIEINRLGLKHIIDASCDIFRFSSLEKCATGVLEQLTTFIQTAPCAVYERKEPVSSLAAIYLEDAWYVISGIGKYANHFYTNLSTLVPESVLEKLQKAHLEKHNIFDENFMIVYFEDRFGHKNALLFEGVSKLSDTEKDLIDLFARNISISFENIHLNSDLNETQREMVYLLGGAVEFRSKETGNHVKRVAKISRLLALKYGLSEDEADTLKFASPLHDLGKIAIPDAILNKPGKHTEEESVIMKSHAEIGFNMLKSTEGKILKAASIVALEHHERWDGTGYPKGKTGQEIHIYGRITALADVFDALLAKRCYKEPWPLERVLDLLQQEKGKHFEPKLVDLALQNLDELLEIQRAHQD